jgi:ApeA-like protein/HEPN superfamily Apea-like protein
MDDVEYSGLWWLPSNPQNKVAGTLTFSNQDGIELKLIGALEDLEGVISLSDNNLHQRHPVIWGLTNGGKSITLSGCLAAGFRMGLPGFVSRDYWIHLCFLSAHLNEDELQFKRLAVEYSRLVDWVRTSGLTMSWYENEPNKRQFNYTLPEEIKATTTKGTVSIDFSFEAKGDFFDEMHLRQSISMEIEADREREFDDLQLRYIRPFQNFLTLATTKPNSIVSVQVYSKHISFEKSDRTGVVETPIEVIFPQRHLEAKSDKILLPDYMLFTFHDIADFQTTVEKWLNVSEELDSVCSLFFGIMYNSSMYLEQEFLNMVQAVESYHRRRMKNNVLPKDEHKARVRAILSESPGEYKDWLKEVLNYSNEPRLKHRLSELFDKTEIILSPLISSKEEFSKKITDTRNYLTHYDQRLKDKAAKGGEIALLTAQLSYMLQACLLFELGFTQEKCVEVFRRNQGYIQIMNRAQQRR